MKSQVMKLLRVKGHILHIFPELLQKLYNYYGALNVRTVEQQMKCQLG